MERKGKGLYVAFVVLGECRCESFRLSLDQKKNLEIYPTIKHASRRIWIEGPDGHSEGRSWRIDGRDRQEPAGTVYRVSFHWHSERKSIHWEVCRDEVPPPIQAFKHRHSLVGTFTSQQLFDMVPTQTGEWEGTFKIGSSGSEEFQIVRDGDRSQVIYPMTPQTVRTGVPVRGPDEFGDGKCWLVHGRPGDKVVVKLTLLDAHVSVSVLSGIKGAKVWESAEGWARHDYHVAGSWAAAPIKMVLEDGSGVFKAYGRVRGGLAAYESEYVEGFRILIDEDFDLAFYPQGDLADSGASIVMGPGPSSTSNSWAITSPIPYACFEISFDPNAIDRRKMVTWSWPPPIEQ